MRRAPSAQRSGWRAVIGLLLFALPFAIVPACGGAAVVILDATGQNQIVVANGANDTLTAAEVLAQRDSFVRSQAVIVQLETPMEAVEATLRLARECRVISVLNPAPYAPVTDALLHLCDWIIPNENETAKLTGVEVHDSASAASAAVVLKLRSACPRVAVTLGGSMVLLNGTDQGWTKSSALRSTSSPP